MRQAKRSQRILAGCLASAFLALTLASCGEAPAVAKVRAAQKAYDTAVRAETTAQQDVDTANATLSKDKKDLTAAQNARPKRENAITQAKQNKTDGEAAYQLRQEQTVQAQDALTQVKKDQEEPRRYQDSSLGFFLWNAEDSGSNIEQITRLFLGQEPGSTEVTPDLSDPRDGASYRNFKASIQWIDKCNEMRRRENQSEGTQLKDLAVTDWAMAVAALHADYSISVIGHHAQKDICTLHHAENLAWCSGFSNYNPFEGWYTEEKEQYKKPSDGNGTIGHYLNIVSSTYTVTGFAINNNSSKGHYDMVYAQEFSGPLYVGWINQKAYTTAQYRTRISAYESYLSSLDKTLQSAENSLKNAQSAEADAKDKLTELDAAIASATQARDDNEAKIKTLTAKLDTDRTAIAKAEKELAQKQDATAKAKQELDAAKKALNDKKKAA